MSKLAFAIAAAFTLLLVKYAEATPLTEATAVKPETNYSLIEKTGCWWPLQCAIGRHRVCYWHGHCQCVPCSGRSWFLWHQHDE
jgi:hypothetical protein